MDNLSKYLTSLILEDKPKNILLYPGAFKPPHKGHFEVVKKCLDNVDEAIIIISSNSRDKISSQTSLKIWESYKPLFGSNSEKVKIYIAEAYSPVKEVYNIIKNNENNNYLAVFGKKDSSRFKSLIKNYSNAVVFDGGDVENISSSQIRVALKEGNKEILYKSLPEGYILEDFYRLIPEGEKIPGGLSKGMSLYNIAKKHAGDYYDYKNLLPDLRSQLKKGIKVELEHTNSKSIAREIAMDHLYEDPKYYDKLSKIEKVDEAKQVGIIYHFTSMDNFPSIFESNKLMSSGKLERNPRNNQKDVISISFTRNKDFWKGFTQLIFPPDVRIVIDGDKLSNKYRIEPFNYFNQKTKNKEHSTDEREERIPFDKNYDKPEVEDLDNYVMSYDFLLDNITKNYFGSNWSVTKDFLLTNINNPKFKFFTKEKEISKEEFEDTLIHADPDNELEYEEELVNEYENQKKLNPVIFDGDNIKPKVKKVLLKIAEHFWNSLDLDVPYEDIILLGSSANYNWNQYSDIDVHILVDLKKFKDPEITSKYFTEAKNSWNKTHDLKIKNNYIEVYVQDTNEPNAAQGVYSLIQDKWIKKPKYEQILIPDKQINDKANIIKQEIDNLIQNPELNKVQKLYDYIKNMRKSGLEKEGEYSIENLVFKELRNSKYIEKLVNLKTKEIDKELLKETKIKNLKVYHGTNSEFDEFDLDYVWDGIWFTDNKDSIKKGETGALGNKNILTRYITLENPATWEEYEKYSVGELINMGHDGVILPEENRIDYLVFHLKNIKKQPIDKNILEINIPKHNYIKSFYNILYESLCEIKLSTNNAVKIEGDIFGGYFKVGDIEYEYSIKNMPNPYKDLGLFYNIQFHPKGIVTDIPTKNITGKEYIKILSTMYKIIVDFVYKEKPDYIAISSMDNNETKNYHNIYNNLIQNNNLPGYFKKTANLPFVYQGNTGKMVVLKKSNDFIKENKNKKFKKHILYINKLVEYVCKDLKIEKPKIIIKNKDYAQENKSFGGYNPENNEIYIVIEGRNLRDSCVTLVHELRHCWQNKNNMIKPGDGKDGDPIENDAQSYAGMIMRKFGRENPEIFNLLYNEKNIQNIL